MLWGPDVGVVTRQAIGLLVLSLAFTVLIIRLSRTRRLSYRYTLGWLLFGLLIGLSVVPLLFLEPVADFVGVPPLNIGLLALGVVVLGIAIELSLAVSHIASRQRTLGMHQALGGAGHDEGDQAGRPEVLVVIPALNEEESIGSVIRGCRAAGFDCLVINDGSTDATEIVARQEGATVLSAPFNLGIGVALRAGFIWAVRHGYRTAVQCDADGQQSPHEITRLVEHRREHEAHLVIGSRFAQANDYPVGRLRRGVMRWLARRATAATGTEITDASSGFRCIHGELLDEFARIYPADYMDSYEALVAAGRAGYTVVETFTPMRERTTGTASNSPVRAAFHTVKVLTAGLIGTRLDFKRFDQ